MRKHLLRLFCHVGDSISDIQAAIAAGVHPILVLTGLGMEHLRECCHEAHEPFHIAESLKHVAEMLLNFH